MTKITTDRKIGLFAPSGYGKTHLAKALIKKIADSGITVYIYDTDYEYSQDKAFIDHVNVIIHSPILKDLHSLRHLNNYLKVIRTNSKNAFVYIVDLDLFYDKATSNSFDNSELKLIASAGRHQRLGLIYEAKQTAFIPTKLISNTNLFYIGQFSTPTDMKKLSNIVSTEEFAQLDRAKHEFWEVDALYNTKRKVII